MYFAAVFVVGKAEDTHIDTSHSFCASRNSFLTTFLLSFYKVSRRNRRCPFPPLLEPNHWTGIRPIFQISFCDGTAATIHMRNGTARLLKGFDGICGCVMDLHKTPRTFLTVHVIISFFYIYIAHWWPFRFANLAWINYHRGWIRFARHLPVRIEWM